jgi:hypothetical protein
MSTCYKNFPVIITYEDGSTEKIYANSVSLNENVNLESMESLGAKGATSVLNRTAPEGSISIESYMSSGILQTLDLIQANNQNITIQFGPYQTPSPCVLNSMNVSVSVGEPLSLSRDYTYYGSVSTVSLPTPDAPEITPVIPEGVSISGYSTIGGSNIITDMSWSVSQNYQTFNLLGNVTPVVVYSNGQKSLDINGESFTESLMQSPTAGCVVPPKDYSVTISGCGTGLGTLTMSNAYMTSRSSDVDPESVEKNSVSIIEYL